MNKVAVSGYNASQLFLLAVLMLCVSSAPFFDHFQFVAENRVTLNHYKVCRRVKGLPELELLMHMASGEPDADYAEIVPPNTSIIIFGEMHGNPRLGTSNDSTKDELIKHMSAFKQIGFGCLGLEMFPAGRQDLLDRYFAASESQGGQSLEGEILQVLTDFWGWAPEKHLELIRAAKKHGIRPVGLHNGGDQSSDSYMSMSRQIADFLLDNPGSRIIVFAGSSHLFNMGQYLEEFKPFKIALLGGANYYTFGKNGWTAIEQAAKQFGIEDRRLLIRAEEIVPVLGYNPVMGADIYIHLPAYQPSGE